jgi:PST family polysaccharide transporter
MLAVSSPAVARFSFGDERHANAIALLSVVVFLRIVADAHGALIQGMRRIVDLAALSILGSAFGVAVAIPIVYWLGVDGIVPSFIVGGAISLMLAWRVGQRIHPRSEAVPLREFFAEFEVLIRLGAAFMVSGLLMMGAAYAVRTLVLRQEGAEAAGLYGAAWALAGLWVGFILQAMGTDFYPRLVAEVENDARCNAIVNEQTEVSLLLAAPGMLATITLAPAIVSLLYSAEFAGSVNLMRWLLLGMALRVVTWPMGFIVVARNRQRAFIFAELAWTIVNLSLSFYFVDRLGLDGAGVAFFLSYVFHGLMIYPLVRRMSGFHWTPTSCKLILAFALSLAVVFAGFASLSSGQATALGIAVSVISAIFSVSRVLRMTSTDRIPHRLQKLLRLARSRP